MPVTSNASAARRVGAGLEAGHDPRVAAAPHDQADRPLRGSRIASAAVVSGLLVGRQRDELVRADAEVVEGRGPAARVGPAERAGRAVAGHRPQVALVGASTVRSWSVAMFRAIWRLAPTHHSKVYWATKSARLARFMAKGSSAAAAAGAVVGVGVGAAVGGGGRAGRRRSGSAVAVGRGVDGRGEAGRGDGRRVGRERGGGLAASASREPGTQPTRSTAASRVTERARIGMVVGAVCRDSPIARSAGPARGGRTADAAPAAGRSGGAGGGAGLGHDRGGVLDRDGEADALGARRDGDVDPDDLARSRRAAGRPSCPR